MSQIRYINYVTGKDVEEYTGSVDKPFKTISYALTRSADGDELQLVDMSMVADGIYHEDTTLVIDRRNNLTIRFGTIAKNGKLSGMKWETGSGDVAIKITGCNNIRIMGIIFICDNEDQNGCIEISESKDIEIYSCEVDSFRINSPTEKLFRIVRSSATLTNVSVKEVSTENLEETDVSPRLTFIDAAGDSTVNIYSCSIQDYSSEKASIVALHADHDTRTLNVNGFLVHNCESTTEEGSVGIKIEANAGSFINFDIRNAQFSNIRTGFLVTNLPPAKKQVLLRIANSTFYKCKTAIVADDSDFTATNINVYGNEEHVYSYKNSFEGEDLEADIYGVIAKNNSTVSVMNTAVTFCDTCFAAYDNSLIEVTRTVFCDNNYFKEVRDDSEVTADDYVRATDPMYFDIESSPYGNFRLDNRSPCINAGRLTGLSYTGSSPNIGAIDQDRYLDSSDLMSVAARQVRKAETYRMTEMDVEGLIVSGLKAMEPDSAADREGSAIRDLFIKPATELSSFFITELENVRNGMSFLNIDSMTDGEADALAANLIVSRKTGFKATGVIRMFFDKAIDLEVPAETMFSTSSGLHFYSISKTNFSREEMQANLDGNMYYAEVVAEGEAPGATYNVGPGEITICNDITSASLMAVTNVSSFSGGESRETNRELYERVKLAITTRCLNTIRGVKFQFLEAFSFIRRLTVIGKGDPEMIRDDLATLLEGTGISLPDEYDGIDISATHIGGKTDVYTQIYEPIDDDVVVEAIPELSTLSDLGLTDKPVLRINSIEVCDPITKDGIGVYIPDNKWQLISNDPRVRFSVKENMSLAIDEEYVGDTVKINYKWVYEIPAMQKWTEADNNRVICEDILVKHYQPAFVSTTMAYHAAEEVPEMVDFVEEFIQNIPEKKSLRVSDLIDFLYEKTAIHVITPVLITAVLHKNDGEMERFESYDEIILPRTACFLPDKIEILYLGEDPL